MQRTVLSLLVCLTVSHGLAQPALESAHRAVELLGPGVWSRVLRIENNAWRGAYPRTVYAAVFELAGILWFYCDLDGTQSLSLHRDNVAAEKADLLPLLRAIEPGFRRFSVLRARPPDGSREQPLPNGCLVESYAALRERVARGEFVNTARLLSYYVEQEGRKQGHTLLVYEGSAGVVAVDPAEPLVVPDQLRRPAVMSAVAFARTLRPDLPIASARWVGGLTVPDQRAATLALAASGEQPRKQS